MTNRMSHTNCDHARTPAARAECRKAGNTATDARRIAHVTRTVDDITLSAIRGTGVANADELDALDASLTGCKPKRVKTPGTLKITYELIERTIEQRGSIVVTVVTSTESTAVELTHINSATVFGTDVNGDTFSANRRDIINIRLS